MTEDDVRKRWEPGISSELNEMFLQFKAYSGYSLQFADPEGTFYLLSPNVSYVELGQAVINTFEQSQFSPYKESEKLFVGWDK